MEVDPDTALGEFKVLMTEALGTKKDPGAGSGGGGMMGNIGLPDFKGEISDMLSGESLVYGDRSTGIGLRGSVYGDRSAGIGLRGLIYGDRSTGILWGRAGSRVRFVCLLKLFSFLLST